MNIEERIEQVEKLIEDLKNSLNTNKPDFKVGEVYSRKGHNNKYALTYLDKSDTICLINLTYGTTWNTKLNDYQSKKDVTKPKRSITYAEMQYLTGNKADEFKLNLSPSIKFYLDDQEIFIEKLGNEYSFVDKEGVPVNPLLKDFSNLEDLVYAAIETFEINMGTI